jgi:hypothetical protein
VEGGGNFTGHRIPSDEQSSLESLLCSRRPGVFMQSPYYVTIIHESPSPEFRQACLSNAPRHSLSAAYCSSAPGLTASHIPHWHTLFSGRRNNNIFASSTYAMQRCGVERKDAAHIQPFSYQTLTMYATEDPMDLDPFESSSFLGIISSTTLPSQGLRP